MIITQTPLRVSFAGGGSDLPDYYQLHEGYVVSAAIDKFVSVIITARYDDKIYVNYSRKEIVDRVDHIEHELVREAMRLTGVTGGVEVTMLSDIPAEGSGLASSSSFTVGLLNAFHVYQGDPVGPAQLAEEACEIEIQRCRKPIGKQDQYIAAYGGVAAFRFCRDGTVDVERVRLCDRDLHRLSANLFLFYTNQTRQAASILSDQRENTRENLPALDEIKQLAVETRSALEHGQFDRLGTILDRGWRLKRSLATRISNRSIDAMYQQARSGGATGAKLCGAGGGGFLMTYCPSTHHDRLRDVMRDHRELPFHFEPEGSRVILHYRRTAWR